MQPNTSLLSDSMVFGTCRQCSALLSANSLVQMRRSLTAASSASYTVALNICARHRGELIVCQAPHGACIINAWVRACTVQHACYAESRQRLEWKPGR
jgi:hypothetical protein